MKLDSIKDQIGEETIMLVGMIILAVYFYTGASQYPEPAATFPEAMAVIVMLGSFVLLLQNLFPSIVQKLLFENGEEVGSRTADIEEMAEKTMNESALQDADNVFFTIGGYRFTTLEGTISLTAIYTLSGYIIGFMWTTPIFIATYAKMVGLSNRDAITLIVLGIAISYAFLDVFNLGIDEGLITGW